MKKIIKRILLVLLLVFILFYVYRFSLFLYAYNVIDKKVSEKLSGDYAIKMNIDNRIMKGWQSEKYYKISFYVNNASTSEFGETVDTWYDVDKNIEIMEQENNKLVVYSLKSNDDFMRFPLIMANNSFATNWSNKAFVDSWKKIGDFGFVNALFTTFVQPVMSVSSIKTEEINGKETYIVSMKFGKDFEVKKYVDKETMLPVKSESIQPDNTNITTYEFSFEPITKESLEFPNIDEYYVIMN